VNGPQLGFQMQPLIQTIAQFIGIAKRQTMTALTGDM